MDRQRHRLLTENVSYFQQCLTVTRELLKTCVDEGVLREEEEQTIWDEESLFGKSLELVYFLRKKDDVSYDKFVEILKQKRGIQDRLVDIMSKKHIEIDLCGPSTENLLNEALRGKVKREIIRNLAAEIEQKEQAKMDESQLETEELKKGLEIAKENAKILNRKFKEHEKLIEMYRDDIEEKEEEVDTLTKQFDRLNKAREKQGKELQAYKTVNEQYHLALQSINQTSGADAGQSEYDEDIKKAEETIKNLNDEKTKVVRDLETKNAKLKTLKEGIERIRQVVLPNNTEATLHDIEQEIKNNTEIKFLNETKEELLKEIEIIGKKRNNLNRSIGKLRRDQSLIEFDLRNEQAKTTRMIGWKKYESLPFAGSAPGKIDQIVNAISLPQDFRQTIEKGRDPRESIAVPLSTARSKTPRIRPRTAAKVYCLLCRNTVDASNPGPCIIHTYGLSEGMWSCCKRRRDGKGCYSKAKHCYFSIDSDSTDAICTIDRAQSIAFY